MNILVLTSKQNFVWLSMQEIIPFIEHTWLSAQNKNYDIKIIDVDTAPLSEITREALTSSQIVLTCFNIRICKAAEFIRFNLKLSVNFIVYVHNMATIAFWPFRKFGNKNFFRAEDTFVTSCENDEKTLYAIFKNPRTLIAPFFFKDADLNHFNKKIKSELKCVYVGRISSQKNLANLIRAYGILKRSRVLPKLHIFGKEDGLGSPNMGFRDSNYQEELDVLVKDLSLTDDIIFEGHKSREYLNHFLIENTCLSISTSLHSDENFGMAILQSLLLGNHALISNWGGHSDFKKYFSNRVYLMPVQPSKNGPLLIAKDIAYHLNKTLENISFVPEDFNFISYYGLKNQIKRINYALTHAQNFSEEPLEFTNLANAILHQKNIMFEKHPTQIFIDYSDPLYLDISEFYIGS